MQPRHKTGNAHWHAGEHHNGSSAYRTRVRGGRCSTAGFVRRQHGGDRLLDTPDERYVDSELKLADRYTVSGRQYYFGARYSF